MSQGKSKCSAFDVFDGETYLAAVESATSASMTTLHIRSGDVIFRNRAVSTGPGGSETRALRATIPSRIRSLQSTQSGARRARRYGQRIIASVFLFGCSVPPMASVPPATATAVVLQAPTMTPPSTSRPTPLQPTPTRLATAIAPPTARVTAAALTRAPAIASPAPSAVSGAQLTYRREGGFAGFCDELHIIAPATVIRYTCKSDGLVEIGRRSLSASETGILRIAQARLHGVSFVQRDKAVADGMAVSLTLQGSGVAEASPLEQSALVQFAQSLLDGPFASDR